MTKSECRIKPEARIAVQASCLLAFALAAPAPAAPAAPAIPSLAAFAEIPPLPVPTLIYHSQDSTRRFWLDEEPGWKTEVLRLTGTNCAAMHELSPEIVTAIRASGQRPLGLAVWVQFESAGDACAITPKTDQVCADLEGLCAKSRVLLGDLVTEHLMIDCEWRRPSAQILDVVHNESITCHDLGLLQRLNRVAQILRYWFPAATQHWYHAGQVELIRGNWTPYSFGAEWLPIRPPVSCTLYEWQDHPDRMVDKLNRNLERAGKLGVDCNPIVSLGAGYVTALITKPDGVTVVGTPLVLPGQPPRFYIPQRTDAWKLYQAGMQIYGSANNVRIKTVTIYPGPSDTTPCPGAGGAPLNKWWRLSLFYFARGAFPRMTMPPGLGNTIEGDFDGDGDVDMDDFGIFQRAVTGPAVPASQAPAE